MIDGQGGHPSPTRHLAGGQCSGILTCLSRTVNGERRRSFTPSAGVRRAVPAARRGPGRGPMAGGGQRHRAAAGAAGLPRRLCLVVRFAAGVALPHRQVPAGGTLGGAVPTGMAQARCERGVPGCRGRPRGHTAAEPPLGSGGGPQARLGQVPLVPPGAPGQVLPGHRDRAGRWHVAFAAVPPAIPTPGNSEVVGVDRGVTVSAALSTGELLKTPGLHPPERRRLRLLQRRLARAKPGSNRRRRVRLSIARLKARQTDRRRDWTEKVTTDLARRFDLICVENLDVRAMTRTASGTVERPGRGVRQKTGLNRAILANGWGRLVDRLEHKAPGRVQKVAAAYTSQRCSACGHVAAESRQSQTAFRCVACAWAGNADYNAARNIAAAGQVVAARGGQGSPRPVNREPPTLGAVA
jgi:hypothetical protein